MVETPGDDVAADAVAKAAGMRSSHPLSPLADKERVRPSRTNGVILPFCRLACQGELAADSVERQTSHLVLERPESSGRGIAALAPPASPRPVGPIPSASAAPGQDARATAGCQTDLALTVKKLGLYLV